MASDPLPVDPRAHPEFDRILMGYVEVLNLRGFVDPDEVRKEYPQLGPALLEDLETFVALQPAKAHEAPLGVLGDYTLRRQIGRGGMGVVYEAWQGSMDRRVALKVMPCAIAADTRAVARFIQEAQLAGKLSHPNIVHVHGMGVEQQVPYYAMDFVEGETLAQILTRVKDAEPETETPFGKKDSVVYFGRLAEAFADVADGLQHAHAKKVIHRDIKPSNLILDSEGRLRILDFGLARLEGQESLTQSGDLLGTPQYMSPEQARRKRVPVDHRTDVYSLGATMYEAVCGRPPFLGKDYQDTLSQIIERDPVGPKKVSSRVPKDLETIVLKCLRKEAGERYGTAEALGQDLRRFARGDAIEARPLPGWERFLRRVWRQRSRIGLASSVTLCLVIAATLAAVLWSQQQERLLASYSELVGRGIDVLEMGLLAAPFDREGEVFSLGILYPGPTGTADLHNAAPALSQFQQATEILPDRPEAYFYLSRAHTALGSFREAEAALDDSLRRDPGFLPALLLKSHELRQGGRGEQADALLSTLDRAYGPGWQRDWLDGHLAAIRADWARVEELYTRMIQSREMPFAGFQKELRLRRGRVRLRQGHEARALQDFHQVWDLSAGAIGPSLVLAAAYFSMDERDEAWLVIQNAVERSATDEELLGVVSLLAHFGELERAKGIASRVQDVCMRYRALLQAQSSLELGKEAVAAGCDDPYILSELGEAMIWDKRPWEAVELLRGALQRHPDDRKLVGQLARTLYFLCEYEELLRLADRYPHHPGWDSDRGWIHTRLGQLEQAKEKLTAEIQRNPRAFVAHYGRSWVHTVQGDLDAALRDHLRLLDMNPAWGGGNEVQLLYGLDPAVFAPYWDELDTICAAAVRRKLRVQPRYLGFRALACLYRKDPDPELALKLAEQAVKEAGERGTGGLAEALHYLGEVRSGRGELAEAIPTFEQAVRLPRTWSKSSRDLQECRSRYFPRLASCASVDAYLQGDLLGGEDPLAHLPQVRASMARESPAIGAYLEARLLERDGRIDEAMRRLEPLVLADPGAAPELVLRLAEWQARSGDAGAALRRIEERFATTAESSPWVAWIRIASAGELAVPALVERLGSFSPEKPGFRVAASDVQWLLRCLHEEGVVRLHCGGGEYTDVHGNRWGRDRFFEGGEAYGNPRPRLKIPEDPDLYYDHRRFLFGATARNAYRIPLLRGRYDVTLHLCAPDPRPEPRRFQLAVEGENVGQVLDLVKDPGVGALRLERIEVEVTDGALDLLFEPLPGCYAVVNAIEVAVLPRK